MKDSKTSGKTISFQIEPRHWPADLGPIEPVTFRMCGMSCAVIYDLDTGQISIYGEKDLKALGKALRAAKRVIGCNCLGFDRHLLAGLKIDVHKVNWVDLWASAIQNGKRPVSLSEALKAAGIKAGPELSLQEHRRQVVEQDLLPLVEGCVNDAINLGKLILTRKISSL